MVSVADKPSGEIVSEPVSERGFKTRVCAR